MPNAVDAPIPWDESHVWGRFRELAVSDDAVIRWLQYDVGGRTSLHRHPDVDETLLVVDGSVRYCVGTSPETLTCTVLGPGGVVRIAAGSWHSAEAITGTHDTQGRSAHAIEHCNGSGIAAGYVIERATSARPPHDSRSPRPEEGL